jgi:signal transduction histidine kinase
MMPITPLISTLQREKLWKDPAPLWLWDVAQARIAWANQACLVFSRALSLDDLIRLKFSPETPFIRQLAALSSRKIDPQGVRELLRFPTQDGEFVFDCRCRIAEIEPDKAGVLVELVADKGKVAPTPTKEQPKIKGQETGIKKVEDKGYENGLLKKTDKWGSKSVRPPQTSNLHPQSEPPVIAAKNDLENSSVSPEIFDAGQHVNGFQVEAENVDEEDLLTLQEIARMINGPGGNGLGQQSSGNHGARPAVATRSKEPGRYGTDKGDNGENTGSSLIRTDIQQDIARSELKPDHHTSVLEKNAAKATISPKREPHSDPFMSERNYFLESLPAALAIAMGGRLMRANEAFLYAFGFGSESELRKAGGLAALFPDSHKGILISDKPGVGKGPGGRRSGRSVQITTLAVSRSGRRRQIPIAFRNVSTGRDPVQILILHEDMFAQESDQLQTQGRTKQERLAGQDDKTVGQDSIDFLATVSHEVRTPLNSIIGFSELMKDERFGAVDINKFRDYAGDIHVSAMHALSLINDLLDITKIIAGKPDLDLESVKVDEVITDAINTMSTQAERKRITLQAFLEKGVPSLYADRRSIKQIFLNLISNAIKFTAVGGRVSVSSSQERGGGVLLTVVDTGIGMRKDQIDIALEPFAQLKSVEHCEGTGLLNREKGTGLGLPLTKALVKAHQASFKLDSSPGQGTRIEIHFPPDRLIRGKTQSASSLYAGKSAE